MDENKIKVMCVGRRHLEFSRMPDGNILMTIMWKGTQELAHLILVPAEANKMLLAVSGLKKNA